VATFQGDYVNFESIWCWPKPAQQPHPPVLLGGESSYTLQRVVDYCEGWFPRSRQPELVTKGMRELQERAAKAGRDMQTISVSVFGVPGEEPKRLDAYREAGVNRCILRLPSEGRETILPLLDQYAKLL
jgi:alkanesulfonate monooxygenase SsuD/methylene tetrahydromethanopterin reductase-like flavin-dependent oxidoreductase (luciferase family)